MTETRNRAARLQRLRGQLHSNCVVCTPTADGGLGVDFRPLDGHGVEAEFACDAELQGYDGMVHGGVIAAILDGAMTNCLFALGLTAVTAELRVRFLHPLSTGRAATVRAWRTGSIATLHVVKAEIEQNNTVKATAQGKFMEQPHLRPAESTATAVGAGPC